MAILMVETPEQVAGRGVWRWQNNGYGTCECCGKRRQVGIFSREQSADDYQRSDDVVVSMAMCKGCVKKEVADFGSRGVPAFTRP